LFYLKPKQSWTCGSEIWFEGRAIGKNTLDKRVKEMCSKTCKEGNYSNHSLRATAITRMYDAGLQEREIMKRSGHRSVEGVRTYKRDNPNETKVVSNVLAASKPVSDDGAAELESFALGGDVDDALLASILDDYEKTQQQQSSINLSGLLQGATASHVNINININGR
jgi:hypothetical protein